MMWNPYQQTLLAGSPDGQDELERFRRAQQAAEMQRRLMLEKAASTAATTIPAQPVLQRDPMQPQDPVQVKPPLTHAPWEGVSIADLARAANGPDEATMERFRRQRPPEAPVMQRQPMQIQDPTQLPQPSLTPAQQAIVRPPRPTPYQYPAVSDMAETNPPASPPAAAPAARPQPQSTLVDAGGTPRVWNAEEAPAQYPPATLDKGPSTRANLQAAQRQYEGGAPNQQPQRNVPTADQVNKLSWDRAVLTGDAETVNRKAIEGMKSQPDFMQKARSWLDQLGSYFDPAGRGENPNEINPAYGVPNAQVWEAQRGVLFNAGILLMAAGMPNTPSARAQIIASMGPALNQTADQLVKVASIKDTATGRTPTDLKIYEQYQTDPEFRKYWDKYKMGQTDRFMEQERYKLWTNAKEGGYREAQLAKDTMTTTKQMWDLVQKGIFTGSFAEQRRNAANFLTTFLPGLTDAELEEAVANDFNFRGLVMEQVLPRMQELGGNDSEKELEELRTMIAAPDTPRRAIEMKLRQIMEKQVMRYNRLRTIGDMSTPEGDPYRLPQLQERLYTLQPLGPAQSSTGGGTPPPVTSVRPRVISED